MSTLPRRFGNWLDHPASFMCSPSFRPTARSSQTVSSPSSRCFATTLPPAAHRRSDILDEVGDSALDRVCYMWWDIFPFAIGMNGLTALDRALLDVMKQQLTIDHDAVRESALHGLGHIVSPRESAVQIIDAFLDSHPRIRPELRQYALDARAGGIT